MARKRGEEPDLGTFVGAGGFGVDSRRAVKVLRARQLGQASEAAPLLWVRVAVLSGASRAVLHWEPGRFEARFDGAPLPPLILARPYDAHLGAMDGTPLMRQFGLALLHLARPDVAVEVVSGPADARRAIYLEGPGAAPPAATEDGLDETVVRAYWSPAAQVPRGHPEGWDLGALLGRLDSAPMPVTVIHRGKVSVVVPWAKRFGREGWVGEVGGLRCGLRLLPRDWEASVLQLCVDGVGVAAESPRGAPLAAEGWVDSPHLTLNASLDRVVQGSARDHARSALQDALQAALLAGLERHARRMTLTGAALRRDPALARFWGAAAEEGTQVCASVRERLEAASGRFRGPSGDRVLVEDTAVWTAAWRAAAKKREGKPTPAEFRPVYRALAATPLFFDSDARPVLLRDKHRASALSRADAAYLGL
ncbi:hypothetical protein EPO15_10840 [bacterium]|nr:MAG: hypothetical protein EPO15_10840 [bacterium]